MYNIKPQSIKTFIQDTSIKLPRFQRKLTWEALKNFELCISLFKEFPMGVCILNVDTDKGKTTKWLLDGRQRRNALSSLWEDPENIYKWSKKWIGFKPNCQPSELEKLYWEKINDYLEEDDENEKNKLEEDEGKNDEESFSDISTINDDIDTSKNGLEFLLEILILVHNKTSRFSGFTRPFDFTDIISNLPYEINVQSKRHLSSKKLKTFIGTYKSFAKDENLNFDEKESFKNFMHSRFGLSDYDKKRVNKKIDENWKKIYERIEVIDKIDNLLIKAEIGLIEIENISPTDSQKIFNIINSKGTKLSAVEILSAKPSWNTIIKSPTSAQRKVTQILYEQIEIKNEGVVKWDLPATILLRLDYAKNFFKSFDDPKNLDSQLTLGFKLLAGIFEKGIKKEDIDKLEKNNHVHWELDYDTLIYDLNSFSKVIFSSDYFKFFTTWNRSIMSLLSDAIALNFFLVLFADWQRKGKPLADNKAKQFQKNSFVLFDQLVYEYITRQWRGSSDSKIAKNLNSINVMPDVFTPVSKRIWQDLLKEIFEFNKILNVKIEQRIVEPILYHFYCLKRMQAPDTGNQIEVDHIFPQSLFETSTYIDATTLAHNLFNLGLLPKRENASKGNKKLISIIDSPWLTEQIFKYEFIPKEKFEKLSDLNNLDELKSLRAPIFFEAFDKDRDSFLNN